MKKLIVLMFLLFATPLYANDVIIPLSNASYSVMQLRQFGATKEFALETPITLNQEIRNVFEWIVNIAYNVPIQENKEEVCKNYRIFIKALLLTAEEEK